MQLIGPIFLLFGPLILVSSLVYWVGGTAEHPRVSRTLRLSAVMWFAVLTAIYSFVFLAAGTCSGDMLYGYFDCMFIPSTLANASLPLFALSTVLAVIYAVGLAMICGIIEWRFRRQ